MSTPQETDFSVFVPEMKIASDGESLYRFTFDGQKLDDLSEPFYCYVESHLRRMDYAHITIHCVNGHPVWLTKFFDMFAGYGLPVEVTPRPTDPKLLAAIESAARYTPYKWGEVRDADAALDHMEEPLTKEKSRAAFDEILAFLALLLGIAYVVAGSSAGHWFGLVTGVVLVVSGVLSTWRMTVMSWLGWLGIVMPLGYVLAGIVTLCHLPG